MSCSSPGSTHHAACACREAAHAEEVRRLRALLREAHPIVIHAANMMHGEMARDSAGDVANRIRAALAARGAPMSADPLEVQCPSCAAKAGHRCYAYSRERREITHWMRKPHAARVRAAERAEKEKVNRG